MKAEFIHGAKEIIGVLGVNEPRLRKILQLAQEKMKKKYPTGTKSRFLEMVVDECVNINEVIACTIEWKTITDEMQRRQMAREANRPGSQILNPNGSPAGIIKPLK